RGAAEEQACEAVKEAVSLQQEQKWPEARSAILRAQGVLAGVGADPALQERVDSLAKDIDMVWRLEDTRVRGTLEDDGNDGARMEETSLASAFLSYGLDLDSLTPKVAAERIQASAIGAQLCGVLDRWARVRRRLKDDRWRQVVEVARR